MDFLQAVKAMKERKKVRRNNWAMWSYHYFMDCNGFIYSKDNSVEAKNAYISYEEIEATDWEIFEEPNFNLSKKITVGGIGHFLYFEDDIREFVRQLKSTIAKWDRKYECDLIREIDNLLGDKLKEE